MPITLTAGTNTPIPLGNLTDLKNNLSTELSLGNEFTNYLQKPISALPDNLSSTSVQYAGGNQKWDLAPASFTLSGGITGKITVIRSGNILQYTDSFPTEVTLSLSTTANPKSTKAVTGTAGSVYICVELDFSIQSGVSICTQQGLYGLSGSASSSDTFQIAFYKNCRPQDLLGQSIAIAFGDLVLPFHANTLKNLKPGDFLSHTANANLQLGLGANIGFSAFSLAHQWKSGIPAVANSPALTLGVNLKVQTSAKLAYSFNYAGTFEQLLWVDDAGKAHLHLYRSQNQTSSLEFSAGITANLNPSASISTVQDQITKAPKSAASSSPLAGDLSTAFTTFSSESNKLASDIDSKISTLLKPFNNTAQITLDWKIAQTQQNFLLLDYTIDLANPAYANAWADMTNGKFLDALEQSNGSVQLDAGSGLEQVYSKASSIALNFFGQWAGNWSTTQIANSSLIYAGNNTFHLITVEGMQRLSSINKSSTEVDFYFAAEMDLSGAAPTVHPPDLHIILRAANNKSFGGYIAACVEYLTSGATGHSLANQVRTLAHTPNTTQVLQLTFKPSAYENLKFSPVPLTRAANHAINEGDDAANYGAFAQACTAVMTSSPANFSSGIHKLSYQSWANWNIAAINAWPAPEGALPNRKQSGNAGGGDVQACIASQFGTNAVGPLFSYAFESATGFMNLCEDLKVLSSQAVDNSTWDSFVKNLLAMVRRDVNFDFVVPATLALSRCCSIGGPQTTTGPTQGLSGNNSIAVTMTFA